MNIQVKLLLYFCLLLSFANFSVPQVSAKGRLFIDGYRQEPWLFMDTGFLGQSKFRTLVRKMGIRPIVSRKTLDELIPTVDNMDLILLSVCKVGNYSGAELTALVTHVNNGGNLLVLTEHDDVYGVSSRLMNPLLRHFEFQVKPNTLFVRGEDWIKISSPELSVENAWFYCSPSFSFNPKKWQVLSQPPVIMACCEMGKILVLGDSEFLLNGNQQFGIEHGNNTKLVQEILKWFALGRYSSIAQKEKQGYAKQSILYIYSGKSGGIIDEEDDGFNCLVHQLKQGGFEGKIVEKLSDVPDHSNLLLLHPLVGDEIARIDKMKRLIVIGDAYSEFDDYTDNGMILTSAGFTNPPPSFFVEVLTRKKLFFPAGCLMNVKNFREEETAISSPFNVGTNSIQIQLKRAGLILPSEEQRICLSSGEHFYNPLSLGLDERVPWCGTMETTFYNRKDVPPENVGPKKHQQNLLKKTRPQSNVPSGPYGIVTIKESTFVLTDADAVSNYYLQTYPENNQIIHWMIDFLREK